MEKIHRINGPMIDEGIDSGDIIHQEKIEISKEDYIVIYGKYIRYITIFLYWF